VDCALEHRHISHYLGKLGLALFRPFGLELGALVWMLFHE